MVKLYCLNINLLKNEFDNILPTISSKRLGKINRLKKKDDKLRSMGAELILKYAIRDANLKCKFEILENEFGKPYLLGADDFHFNISHSNDFVVCATSGKPVGVDIEKITDINLKIADKYFSKNEREYIIKDPKTTFFEIWSHKETFAKAVGKGLSLPLNKFNVVEYGKILNITFDDIKYFFKEYEIDKDYKLAVCSQDEIFCEQVKVMEKIEILLK